MTEPGCHHLIGVIDDDTGIRETLSEILADEGYEVLAAQDGRDALRQLRSEGAHKPCLILLDLMMPVMTGAQFYREQQADSSLKSIPICLLSADGDLASKAAELGVQFMAKPVRIEAVLDVVHRHCARHGGEASGLATGGD